MLEVVEKIIVDTCHFKGNYPDSCSIECCNSNDEDVMNNNVEWNELLSKQKLSADHIHEFSNEILHHQPITHIRLNIYPDGGISRLRLIGKISK